MKALSAATSTIMLLLIGVLIVFSSFTFFTGSISTMGDGAQNLLDNSCI